MYLPPPTTNRAPINVVLSLGVGNHVDLRRLPGGAEGIRTSDLRSAGTRAVDGAAACASAVTASCGYPIREKGKSRGPRLSLDVDSRR
jgi:hypothetical protein